MERTFLQARTRRQLRFRVRISTLNLLEAQSESSFIIKVQANPLNDGETNAILEVNTKVLESYIGDLEIKPLLITLAPILYGLFVTNASIMREAYSLERS